MHRISVDVPAPLGPSTTTNSPRLTVKLTLLTATTLLRAKLFETFARPTTGCPILFAAMGSRCAVFLEVSSAAVTKCSAYSFHDAFAHERRCLIDEGYESQDDKED